MDTLKKVLLTVRQDAVDCAESIAKLVGKKRQAYGWALPFDQPQVQYIIPYKGGFEVLHHSHVERCEYLEQDDPVDEIPGLDDPAGVTNRADHRVQLTQQTADEVNRPEHYTQGGIECLDAIQAALTPEEFRGFCAGNVLKYVWRRNHKQGRTSVDKARFYLERLRDATEAPDARS